MLAARVIPCFDLKPVLVALFLLILAWLSIGCSQSRNAVTNANQLNSFALMKASSDAMQSGRTEDAAFLFLTAQARFEIDSQVYPPTGKGSESPNVLKSALSALMGKPIIEALQGDPVAYSNVVARLGKWAPVFPAAYDPGWKYANSLDAKATVPIVASTLKKIREPMRQKAKLLKNTEYRDLMTELSKARAIQQLHLAAMHQGNRGSISDELRSEYEAATERKNVAAKRMREIEWQLVPESRWHAKVGWMAEDYYDDPQIIALCHAIEANDIAEMERLIEAGVDVNTVGKSGMTPLMWAYPERKLERFECLLEHGANPNIYFESDFGVPHERFHPYPAGGGSFADRGCHAGQAVLHLACQSPVAEYLSLILKHNGDANLVDKKTGEDPLNLVLDRHVPDNYERVELLIAKGADLNRYCKYTKSYPAMEAVANDQYRCALLILTSGADPTKYQPDGLKKVVHFVLACHKRLPFSSKQRETELQALIDWLETQGESLEQAEKEEAMWAERFDGAFTPAKMGAIRRQLILERRRLHKAKSDR